MTDQERQRATSAAAADARDNRGHRLLLGLGITGVLGVLMLGGVLLWQNGHINDQGAKITTLQSSYDKSAVAAQQLVQQLQSHGIAPVVQPPSPGPQGIPGPGPTQAQIDAAVAVRLAEHPPPAGQNATPAMVATAVADFLTAHPPQPGRPPTAEEIRSAAATYIAEHAADFRGSAGVNGTNGKDATDAQVAAAVAAYCDAHGSCAGKRGVDGPQGVSITNLTFARDSAGQCQVIVTLHDPATGKDTQIAHSAGDAACPLTIGAPLVRHN